MDPKSEQIEQSEAWKFFESSFATGLAGCAVRAEAWELARWYMYVQHASSSEPCLAAVTAALVSGRSCERSVVSARTVVFCF